MPIPKFNRRQPVRHTCGGAVLVMLALLAIISGGAASSRAEPLPGGLRLVMVEDEACSYCRKWLSEVGPYYATSLQGQRAPLVRRQAGDASLASFGRLVYTPTFLLVRDGREIDRLVGYGGAAEFWRQIRAMLAKLDDGAGAAPNGPGGEAPGGNAPSPGPDRQPPADPQRDVRLRMPSAAPAA